MAALQSLAKCMGWTVLANSTHLGVGAVEPLGNASSIILASPAGDRYLPPFAFFHRNPPVVFIQLSSLPRAVPSKVESSTGMSYLQSDLA